MNIQKVLVCFAAVLAFSATTHAQTAVQDNNADTSVNTMDELDPFDPNIEQTLQKIDSQYENETGESAHIGNSIADLLSFGNGCYRKSCQVYAMVSKSRQMMYLYQNGNLVGSYATSTGIKGRGTPDFDTHPDGRIYNKYTSTKYPGGDYNGLGNMPYAVFIRGGFAIHGTGQGNWPKLGRPASHGCIRIHPDNAIVFNRMVREAGVNNVWITVQD